VRQQVSLRVGDREFLLTNWAKIKGIARETLYGRLKAGWTPEQIIGEEPRPLREVKPRKLASKPQGPRHRENKLMEPAELQLVRKTVIVTDHEAIGKAAAAIRRQAGLSMEQARKSLGWTISTVYEMEHGRTCWKQKHIDHFNAVAATWVVQKEKSHEKL